MNISLKQEQKRKKKQIMAFVVCCNFFCYIVAEPRQIVLECYSNIVPEHIYTAYRSRSVTTEYKIMHHVLLLFVMYWWPLISQFQQQTIEPHAREKKISQFQDRNSDKDVTQEIVKQNCQITKQKR